MRSLRVLRASIRSKGAVLVAAWLCVLLGCGPDKPPGFDSEDHFDIEIGSTHPNGGALAAAFDFDEPLALSCEDLGTVTFCSIDDPGFVAIEADEAELFVVAPGTQLQIEIIAIDEGVRLKIEDTVLDGVGDMAALGTVPDLHVHPEWQVVAAGGFTGERQVSFRLLTPASAYLPSATYTVTLVPAP